MISIIVPVLNEEKALEERRACFRDMSATAELIFVDGGSADRTPDICRELGKLITSPKGRAAQMNAGAKEASHDVLLFLHADSRIERETVAAIQTTVREKNLAGGCLRQVIERPGLLYRWIAWTGNIRARLSGIFYGDQGIFVRKDVFGGTGGFPDVPLCEDVFFSRRLKREGKTVVLKEKIFVSPRRWEEQGILKTFWLNARISRRLLLNRDPARFAKLYKDVR